MLKYFKEYIYMLMAHLNKHFTILFIVLLLSHLKRTLYVFSLTLYLYTYLFNNYFQK